MFQAKFRRCLPSMAALIFASATLGWVPDDRDQIIREIQGYLGEIRDYVGRVADASSASDAEYAIDRADRVKSKISELNSVKGEDSKANAMVSRYPGFVDSFKESARAVKRLKEGQLSLSQARLPEVCGEAERKYSEIIEDFLRGDPDDRDSRKLQEKADSIGGPIHEMLVRFRELKSQMERNRDDGRRFTVREDEWDAITNRLTEVADRLYQSWTDGIDRANRACSSVEKGKQNPAVIKASYGNCSESDHGSLQREVGNTCKSGVRACTESQGSDELKENRRKWGECASARKNINSRCYDGGGELHRKKLAESEKAYEECDQLLKRKQQ